MNHRDERLGSAPLGKLMFSLALPSVAAQLINVLYNIVDRMYIGHIPGYGNAALTGVGVTFPILTMISHSVRLREWAEHRLLPFNWETEQTEGRNRSLEILRGFWYYFL